MAMYKRGFPVLTMAAGDLPRKRQNPYSGMRGAYQDDADASSQSTDGSTSSFGTLQELGEIIDLLLEVRDQCGRIEARIGNETPAGEAKRPDDGSGSTGPGGPKPGGKRTAKRVRKVPQGTGSPAEKASTGEASVPKEGDSPDRTSGNGEDILVAD